MPLRPKTFIIAAVLFLIPIWIKSRPGTFWNVNLPHPADESSEHELVFCPLDPSPHAFEYENRGGQLHWISDFHNRPRRKEHDIDICMGGQISITEIPIQPFLDDST